jgi:hypothetical protein
MTTKQRCRYSFLVIIVENLWPSYNHSFWKLCLSERQSIYTSFMASVHPVLKVSSWRVSVLIQTKHRIDRRCPHSDRRIIRCYCLRCSSSASYPTHLEYRPSDHPTVLTSFQPLRSVPSAPTLAPMVLSVHPTVSISFLFFASSTWIFAST